MAVTGNLSGSGTLSLSGRPAFPTKPPTTWTEPSGSYTYDIPYWCTYIDVFLLGGGGGGTYGIPGNGGQAGSWNAVTLYRGSGATRRGLSKSLRRQQLSTSGSARAEQPGRAR